MAILVTLFGILMPVRPEQFRKAAFPILTTEEGRVTFPTLERPVKAAFPMDVTPVPITISSIWFLA